MRSYKVQQNLEHALLMSEQKRRPATSSSMLVGTTTPPQQQQQRNGNTDMTTSSSSSTSVSGDSINHNTPGMKEQRTSITSSRRYYQHQGYAHCPVGDKSDEFEKERQQIGAESPNDNTTTITAVRNDGGSGNSVIKCPCCRREFPQYSNKLDFINFHMLKSNSCRSSVCKCMCCNEKFISQQYLNTHLRKKITCSLYIANKHSKSRFQTTSVSIVNKDSQGANITTDSHKPLLSSVNLSNREKIFLPYSSSILPNKNSGRSSRLTFNGQGVLLCKNRASHNSSSDCGHSIPRLTKLNTPNSTENHEQRTSLSSSSSYTPASSSNNYNDLIHHEEDEDDESIQQTFFYTEDDDGNEIFTQEETYPSNMSSFTTGRRGSNHINQSSDKSLGSSDNHNNDFDSNCDNDDSSKEEHQILAENVDAILTQGIRVGEEESNSSATTPVEEEKEPNNDDNDDILNHRADMIVLDEDVLLRMHNKKVSETSGISMGRQCVDSLRLIHILQQKNHSLHSNYNILMQWKHLDSGGSYLSLRQVEQQAILSVYGKSLSKQLQPIVDTLDLPSGRTANVVTFNFFAQLYSLLSDSALVQRENLIFKATNRDNPFTWNRHAVDYDDIETSTYYNETARKLSIDEEKQVLCPLVLYIDETVLDAFGKLGLEPVTFSLLMFNRKTRNQVNSWRLLGYLPNLGKLPGPKSYSPEEKAHDYHYCLNHILQQVKNLHKSDGVAGIKWKFLFSKDNSNNNEQQEEVQEYTRLLKLPLGFVIGDAQGNDVLCGRYKSRSKTKYLARDCDVTVEKSDDPCVQCKFHKMSSLLQLNNAQLNELAFRKLNPHAFADIDFGANPYGINGCTPADPLHQVLLGVVERLPETFVDRLSTNLVKVLDKSVSFSATYQTRNSDRGMPSVSSFTSGVSEGKKLTALEKLGRVYVIYLVLLTSHFQDEVVGKPGRKVEKGVPPTVITQFEYNDWVAIFEETLIFTAWVYHDKHLKIFFRGGRKSIVAKRLVEFMQNYKRIANRTDGMGLKLLKFHQISHLWWIIRLYGSLKNVDAGRPESSHKKRKDAARKTQRRHALMNLQSAVQEWRTTLFENAVNQSGIVHVEAAQAHEQGRQVIPMYGLDDNHTPPQQDNSTSMSLLKKMRGGSTYVFQFDYTNNCFDIVWKSKTKMDEQKKSLIHVFPVRVTESLYKHLKGYNHGQAGRRIKSVEGFTELKVLSCSVDDHCNSHVIDNPGSHTSSSNVLIRACPRFRKETDWFDWATFEWENNNDNVEEDGAKDELVAQVLMFLDFSTMTFEEFSIDDHEQQEEAHDLILIDQYAAYIHSTKDLGRQSNRCATGMAQGRGRHPRGPLSKIVRWSDMEETYQLIDVSCLNSTAFVIDNTSPTNEENSSPCCGSSKKVISIVKQSLWYLQFIDYESEDLINKANNMEINDDVDDIERVPFEG